MTISHPDPAAPALVFACRDWAVFYKPFGVLSEDKEGEVTAPALLRDLLTAENLPFDGVFPVHRLDRTTAGLMVYALSKKGAALLSSSVSAGEVKKVYTAYLAAADDLPEKGELRDRLFFDRKRDKAFAVSPDADRKGAKEAVLRYELTDRFDWRGHPVTEARIELLTGRTHQIRAQFAARKSPLLGDGKYGSRINFKGPALFSSGLSFPWEGKTESFCCHGVRPIA